MSTENIYPIKLTTFINPHLFWIFNLNDEDKRDILADKLNHIENKISNYLLNDVVIIKGKDDGINKRAVIKEIEKEKNGVVFTCWLVDYGMIVNTQEVYSISEELKDIPPFAKQACLKNTVGLHRIFLDGIKFKESATFSVGTLKVANEYISNAQQMFFYCKNQINGIECGDIIIVDKDQHKFMLSELLINEQNISINTSNFQTYLMENVQYLLNDFVSATKKAICYEKNYCPSPKGKAIPRSVGNIGAQILKNVTNDIETNEISIGRGRHRKPTVTKTVPDIVDQNYIRKWVESTSSDTKEQEKYFSDCSTDLSDCAQINTTKSTFSKHETPFLKEENPPLPQTSKKDNEKLSTECKASPEGNSCEKNKTPTTTSLNSCVSATTTSVDKNDTKDSNKHEQSLELTQSSNSDLSSNSIENKEKKTKSVDGDDDDDDDDDDFVHQNKDTLIGCKCYQCLAWNAKDPSDHSKKKFACEQKLSTSFGKPSLLFKKSEEIKEESVEIKSRRWDKFRNLQVNTRLENFVAPKVLVHGSSVPAHVENILSSPFDTDVHRAFDRLGFKYPKQIQAYVWPALMRRTHVFIVGGPKSGKTMSYLPAISSFIKERDNRYPNLPDNEMGPVAIVLCKGCEKAEEVYDLFQKVFEFVRQKPSISLAIPPMDGTRLHQFYKQCDILVATPKTLCWLLHSRIMNLKRLCHLVMEDGDIIYEKFLKEMGIIFGVTENMLEHRLCNYSIQLIVASEKWNVHLERLLKKLNFVPTVCMVNYLEAALYGRVNFEFLFVKEQFKKSRTADLIEAVESAHKIIVFCNVESEIDGVLEYLQLKGISAISITSEHTKEEIYEYETSWMNSNMKNFVIVCTDEVFSNYLCITDATLLIHFSLPSSWSYFSYRFKSMMNNFSSPLDNENVENNIYCKTYVFVDQCCEIQFSRLIQLLQRLDKRLPSKYMEYYNVESRNIEANKIENKITICRNVKFLGECVKNKCSKRHVLSKEIDLNPNLPVRGTVHFNILHIEEVNTFFVKILKFTDVERNLIDIVSENYETMEKELNDIINLERDYGNDVVIVIGGIYGVYEDGKIKRCTVLKRHFDYNSKKIKYVTVKLIDYGPNIKVHVDSLYVLPEKYTTIAPRAFTLYLGNVMPPDHDEIWSSDCKTKLKKALKEVDFDNDRSFFISDVLLLLGNKLWVKNVHLIENFGTFQTTVTKFNVKKVLKEMNIIAEVEEPMKKLYELCKEADIHLPEISQPTSEDSLKSFKQVKPRWAYLDDCEDYNEVVVTHVNSPGEFFVRLKKFDELVKKLQKEIQIALQKPFYPEVFTIVKGCSYLAKDALNNEYRRVLVGEIENGIAKCLFVDYGTTVSVPLEELKILDENLITKLPYQAIECYLYGIESYDKNWQPAATEILQKYTSTNEEPKSIYITTFEVNKTVERVLDLSYGVVLLSYNQDKPVYINRLLVDCGEAVTLDDKPLNLNVSLPNEVGSEEEHEYEFDDVDLHEKEEQEACDNLLLNDPDNHSLCSNDLVLFDEEAFFNEMFGIKLEKESRSEVKKIKFHEEKEEEEHLPVIKALPPAKYSTPLVKWYQTDTSVVITILLQSVDKFDLKLVRDRMLHFKALHNEKEYRLDLMLFAKLKQDFRVTSGLNIKTTFEKNDQIEWPRLVSSGKHRNIKYDLSKLDIPDEEKPKRFLDLQMKDDDDDDDDFMELIIGSDGDYSDSDVESSSS